MSRPGPSLQESPEDSSKTDHVISSLTLKVLQLEFYSATTLLPSALLVLPQTTKIWQLLVTLMGRDTKQNYNTLWACTTVKKTQLFTLQILITTKSKLSKP